MSTETIETRRVDPRRYHEAVQVDGPIATAPPVCL